MSKIFSVLALMLLIACGGAPKEAPAIYFSNASVGVITNIECNWAGKNKLTLSALNPGDSRAQSFFAKDEDFFGPVSVSWKDEKGVRMTKDFRFRRENLPSISDHEFYSYVQLYFMADGLEVVSSDVVDISGKTQMMDRVLTKYRNEAAQRGIFESCVPNRINLYNCPGNGSGGNSGQTSLIRVQPQ